MEPFRNEKIRHIMKLIGRMFIQAPEVYTSGLIAFIQKQYTTAVFFFVSLHGSRYISFIWKHVLHRARPDISLLFTATGYSFPSGQTLNAIAFLGVVSYLIITENQLTLRQKLALITVGSILIGSVAFANLYAVNPFHICAGLAAAGAWLLLCIMFHRSFRLFS